MKAEGVEYEQRMEELEKLEYPKPLRDFVYETFNAFADEHPWVGEENIRPKSIAREMFENFRSFAEYVRDYELQRSEGLLLRHLNSVYKVLSQTVPDGVKTDEVREMELYLRTLLRAGRLQPRGRVGADARSRLPAARAAAGPAKSCGRPAPRRSAADVTRDAKAFTAAIRTRDLHVPARLGDRRPRGRPRGARPPPPAETGATRGRRSGSDQPLDAYRVEHEPRPARSRGAQRPPHARRAVRRQTATWRVQQVLVDPELHNDWMAELVVDLPASREANRPVLGLRGLDRSRNTRTCVADEAGLKVRGVGL